MHEVPETQSKRTWSDRIGSFIDGAVRMVSPHAGARRMLMRDHLRAYDRARRRDPERRQVSQKLAAAEKGETRDRSWLSSNLSSDSELEEDLDTTRKRARSVYKNDSVGGAVDTRVNLVVSYGFAPQSSIVIREGYATEEQSELWNEQLEDVYKQLYPRISLSGRESLWDLLRLVERHHGFDGESFTILSDDSSDPRKPVPLTLEVIDPMRVETPPKKSGDPLCRMGIQYDKKKRIVGYWVRKTHPGDTLEQSVEYDFIVADRMLHVFEKWCAGQSRGLPWLTRTLNRVQDTGDYDEATIIAAQIEACYAAFVVSPTNALGAAMQNSNETINGKRWEDIRPGMFRYLDTGEDVRFGQPTRPGSTYEPFMQQQYRRMAAGMNFPYEMVAKNWAGLSFAAGRLSLADAKLFVRSQQKLLTERWLSRVWARMVWEAVVFGAVDIPPRLYFAKPWIFESHTWTPPKWPYALTPGEEVKAAVEEIDNNLATKEAYIRENGGDPAEVRRIRKRERDEERAGNYEPPGKTETPPAADDPPQERERKAA